MNFRNIAHFSLGLNTVLSRGKASLNSLRVAENVRVHKGDLRLREGQEYIDADDLAPADIKSIYELSRAYYNLDGSQDTYREFVFSAGAYMYGYPEGDVVTLLNNSYPFDSYNVWALEYMDWMYMVNGCGYNPPAAATQRYSMYRYDAVDFFPGYIEAPDIPVIATTGVAAAITGYRGYKYRYIRYVKGGSGRVIDYVASPMSEEAYTPNLTGVNSPVITLAESDNAMVTHIELYCTLAYPTLAEAEAADFYRLDYGVDPYYGLDNVDQNYPDVVVNAEITGIPDSHPALDTSISWTNPPATGLLYLTFHKDRVYAVSQDDPSCPIYSELGVPESWPTDNWLDCRRDDGYRVTGFCSSGNDLYIFKENSIWILTGDPDAAAVLQVKTGGERTGTQTEGGLGCTSPRSLATYGDDVVIFYSSTNGVYMISEGRLFNLSSNVAGITGLSDESAGAVYVDSDGEAFYVLSPPTGNAWVFHITSKAVVNDTNVNVYSFCVDSQGRLLGGEGMKLNQFYKPDVTDDNAADIQGQAQTAWVNLRDGEMGASLRSIIVQSQDIDAVTLTAYTEENHKYETVFGGSAVGINGLAGRLFSILLKWQTGIIESMTLYFRRRRLH